MGDFHQRLDKSLSTKGMDARIEEFYDTASFLKQVDHAVSYDLIFLDILLDEDYDLIFLDILLEEENGYLFAKYLRDEDIQTDIIFITSTEDYAVMGL